MTIKNKCRLVAKKFYKAIKGKVDFVSAEKFISRMGFSVIFYNTPEGDIEAARYGVHKEIDENEAFTYNCAAHIIFIDNNSSCERKLYLLLHEIGHILMDHFDGNKILTTDEVLLDIEANAFVYEVLQCRPLIDISYPIAAAGIVCIFLSVYIVMPLIGGRIIPASTMMNPQDNYSNIVPVESYSAEGDTDRKNEDFVYVTPSGNKFHRAACIHAKDKNCIMITRKQAEKSYTPCTVCNP